MKHIMFFDPNILLFRLPPLLIHEDQNPLAIPPSSPTGFIPTAPNLLAVSSFCSFLLPLFSLFLSVNNCVNILTNLSYFLNRVFSIPPVWNLLSAFCTHFLSFLTSFHGGDFLPLHSAGATLFRQHFTSTFFLCQHFLFFIIHQMPPVLCVHVPQTQNYSSFFFQSDCISTLTISQLLTIHYVHCRCCRELTHPYTMITKMYLSFTLSFTYLHSGIRPGVNFNMLTVFDDHSRRDSKVEFQMYCRDHYPKFLPFSYCIPLMLGMWWTPGHNNKVDHKSTIRLIWLVHFRIFGTLMLGMWRMPGNNNRVDRKSTVRVTLLVTLQILRYMSVILA